MTSLVSPGEAIPVIEDCFRRLAAAQVELMPRRRFAVADGSFAVMAAADRGLGVAGVKSYAVAAGRVEFVVCLFDLVDASLVAMVAADRLGQVRTGAASGVAAKYLVRRGASLEQKDDSGASALDLVTRTGDTRFKGDLELAATMRGK